jgi:hypothetical protein
MCSIREGSNVTHIHSTKSGIDVTWGIPAASVCRPQSLESPPRENPQPSSNRAFSFQVRHFSLLEGGTGYSPPTRFLFRFHPHERRIQAIEIITWNKICKTGCKIGKSQGNFCLHGCGAICFGKGLFTFRASWLERLLQRRSNKQASSVGVLSCTIRMDPLAFWTLWILEHSLVLAVNRKLILASFSRQSSDCYDWAVTAPCHTS